MTEAEENLVDAGAEAILGKIVAGCLYRVRNFEVTRLEEWEDLEKQLQNLRQPHGRTAKELSEYLRVEFFQTGFIWRLAIMLAKCDHSPMAALTDAVLLMDEISPDSAFKERVLRAALSEVILRGSPVTAEFS